MRGYERRGEEGRGGEGRGETRRYALKGERMTR